MDRNDRAVSETFGGEARLPEPPAHRRSAFEGWYERGWDRGSPADRGFVTFAGHMREGTILVTQSSRPGNVHIDLQFADPSHHYRMLTADVREGWLRNVAMTAPGAWSYDRIVDALLEVAALPNQRTVRVEEQRLSA
jgi:hypothetical protein